MSPNVAFWLAVVGWVIAIVSSIGARSLVAFSRRELERMCAQHEVPDKLAQFLKRDDEAALAAETVQLLATTLFFLAVSYWVWPTGHAEWTTFLLVLLGSMLLLVVGVIWISSAVERLWATPVVFFTWQLWNFLTHLMAPWLVGARFFNTLFHRLAGRTSVVSHEESFEDEIRSIVTEGHREGLIEEDAREMIEGVIHLNDVDVAEIMTPRTDMVSMPISVAWQEILDFVVEEGHTRIPVYDKNRDDIVGILVTRDLLPELVKGSESQAQPWTALLREPYFVPETKPVDALLEDFQQSHNHMAIVLDEYGGVAGLATIEDVLEEIVGEIVDEYDKDLVDGIKPLDNGATEVLGNVRLDELNERLQLNLNEDGDFDTIAGFMLSKLGHVPKVGEELTADSIRVTVLEATVRRILKVRIESVDSPALKKNY